MENIIFSAVYVSEYEVFLDHIFYYLDTFQELLSIRFIYILLDREPLLIKERCKYFVKALIKVGLGFCYMSKIGFHVVFLI